jgi:hypothetical protein
MLNKGKRGVNYFRSLGLRAGLVEALTTKVKNGNKVFLKLKTLNHLSAGIKPYFFPTTLVAKTLHDNPNLIYLNKNSTLMP